MAITTSFVQRLVWYSPGPAACIWLGPDPIHTTAFAIHVRKHDSVERVAFKQRMLGVLLHAQLGGRAVTVSHLDGVPDLTSVSLDSADVADRPVQLDTIEVTQSIQDLGHAVPLIAGKRTVARAYVSQYSGPARTVTAELLIRGRTPEGAVTVASANSITLDPAHAGDIASQRNDAQNSLNFVLPDTHTVSGPLQVQLCRLTDTASGDSIAFGDHRQPTVWFHPDAPVRLRVLSIRYVQDGVTHVATAQDLALLKSWLLRAYPTARVLITTGVVDATVPAPFSSGDINAQLAAIRALDMAAGADARTHYYGITSDGGFFMRGSAAGIPTSTPQPATVASGPTGPGDWGWDFDGSYGDWYAGHELGHTYGRLHPGFCGETADDLQGYPFPFGQLASSNLSFSGCDVGDPSLGLPLTALPGTRHHDVMTYCDKEWLSPYTYLGIRRRLVEEDALSNTGPNKLHAAANTGAGGRPDARFPHAPAASASAGPSASATPVLVSLIATVDVTNKQAKIRYVHPLAAGVPTTEPQQSEAQVRVLGPNNVVLSTHSVPIQLDSEPEVGQPRLGLVQSQLAISSQARAIELVLSNHVVDTYVVGGALPSIAQMQSVSHPNHQIAFNAHAQGATAPSVTYAIQLSADDGSTWHTLAVGLTKPEIQIDSSAYDAGQELKVKIIATNGLTSSEVVHALKK